MRTPRRVSWSWTEESGYPALFLVVDSSQSSHAILEASSHSFEIRILKRDYDEGVRKHCAIIKTRAIFHAITTVYVYLWN